MISGFPAQFFAPFSGGTSYPVYYTDPKDENDIKFNAPCGLTKEKAKRMMVNEIVQRVEFFKQPAEQPQQQQSQQQQMIWKKMYHG